MKLRQTSTRQKLQPSLLLQMMITTVVVVVVEVLIP
jgi:hypothetical protein